MGAGTRTGDATLTYGNPDRAQGTTGQRTVAPHEGHHRFKAEAVVLLFLTPAVMASVIRLGEGKPAFLVHAA